MSTYVVTGETTAGVTIFDPVVQTYAGVADYEWLDDTVEIGGATIAPP